MAAMTAAITPSKTVPCRVVNSLLDMMFSTAVPPLSYRVSATAQSPKAWKLQGCPLPPAPTSVYVIQCPQIASALLGKFDGAGSFARENGAPVSGPQSTCWPLLFTCHPVT